MTTAKTATSTWNPERIRPIHTLLSRCQFDFSNEKRLQAGIESMLVQAGIGFEREKHLSDLDIPDFLIGGDLVMECKVRGAKKMDIFRQLERYAQHEEVAAVLLVTNISMGLPEEIHGKPVYYASVSQAWL